VKGYPAEYWRANKGWAKIIGKEGEVVATTTIRVPPLMLQNMAPYTFSLVRFGDECRELMGVDNELLEIGDKVKCVFRRIADTDGKGIIMYGIKIKKVRS
jgi:uncharacterized OB-fold protein